MAKFDTNIKYTANQDANFLLGDNPIEYTHAGVQYVEDTRKWQFMGTTEKSYVFKTENVGILRLSMQKTVINQRGDMIIDKSFLVWALAMARAQQILQ